MARGEIAPGIMGDYVLTRMTPNPSYCTYHTLDTTLRAVCVPLIAPNHLGRASREDPRVHGCVHRLQAQPLCVGSRGFQAQTGSPCLGQCRGWGTLSLQVGSYLQHEVVLRGGGRRHLPQHPLTLQGDGVYGGQERGHDLRELQGKEARAREA